MVTPFIEAVTKLLAFQSPLRSEYYIQEAPAQDSLFFPAQVNLTHGCMCTHVL